MSDPDIDPADWAKINRLLDEALDLPEAERQRWLDSLPSEHAPLEPRLRALLARAASSGPAAPLDTIPKLGVSEDEGGEAPGRPGQTVGPYHLLRLLAEGGMGSVWRAERADGVMNRPVALKLPHGAWLRPGLAERMAREREILASLNHPHIARLYDAGLALDGRPYLALEYVEGRPLDQYAREEELDLPARLRLFLQVAEAVAHAHTRLVVHRDIKPNNILVTADGQARLLDFGIAKLLEQGRAKETELTRLSGRPLTPAYASPEQIENAPLGVASDVYSLGVVLYEILTETRPYKPARDSPAALEEAILRLDPAPPSQNARDLRSAKALRGDLDTIVLKALRKNPEERYATVNALADDLDRYLKGRPVLARPDRAFYRLQKFVGRNKLAVGAAAAVLLSILGGAGLALWQARVALAEKQRAEEVKEFIASIFRDASPYGEQGKALSAVELLKQAQARIDETLEARPDMRVELLSLVGSSLEGLEDFASAEEVVQKAVAEARRTFGESDPRTLAARVLMLPIHRYRGRTQEMRAELATLLPALRAQGSADLIQALEYEAHLALDEGREADALVSAQAAFDMAEARLGERAPVTADLSRLLAICHDRNKSPQAFDAAQRAYRMSLEAYRNPRRPQVIDARVAYGVALAKIGQVEEAIQQLKGAIEDAAEVFGPKSMMVGFFSGTLAPLQEESGDVRGGLDSAERHWTILSEIAEPDSFTYWSTLADHGRALLAARRYAPALVELTTAAQNLKRVYNPAHAFVQQTELARARALGYSGQLDEAARLVGTAVDAYDKASDAWLDNPRVALAVVKRLSGDQEGALVTLAEALRTIAPGPKAERKRAEVLAETGLNRVELGRHVEAVAALEEALALLKGLQRSSPLRADCLVALGRARMALGRPDEGLPLLEEADAYWRELDAGSRWTGEAALWLGRGYASLGRDADARRALSRAHAILSQSSFPADARLARLARRT